MISKQTRTVCTQDGDVLRAKIVGEVDHHSAKDLREEKLGAAFALANPSRRVTRIIELAGLARIIPIETTQSGGNEHA